MASASDAIVSVVIPNWNGRSLLEQCLGALRLQTARGFRTIVVDNGSTDGSLDLLRDRFPEVVGIANARNEGFAKAMNQGIARALEAPGCRFAIALNNDAVADPRMIEGLLDAAARWPRAGSLQAKILVARDPRRIDAAGLFILPDLVAAQVGAGERDDPTRFAACEILGACAAAALYRREALEEVAPDGAWFDPRFFAYFEDVDLALRLRLCGWSARLVPEAFVLHHGSATAGADSPFKTYWIARNRWLTLLKSMPLDLLIERLPLLVLHLAVVAAKDVRDRRPASLWAQLRGHLAGLRDARSVLGERRRLLGRARDARARLEPFIGRSWLRRAGDPAGR